MRYLDLTLRQTAMICGGIPACIACPFGDGTGWLYSGYCTLRRVAVGHWQECKELRQTCVEYELKRAGRSYLDLSLDMFSQAARLGCVQLSYLSGGRLILRPSLWTDTKAIGEFLGLPGEDFRMIHPEIYG